MSIPRRRKFALLMNDLARLLRNPKQAERDFALSLAVWNLAEFKKELSQDVFKTRQVLEFAQALRASDATGRQVAEERLMEGLAWLATESTNRLEEEGWRRTSAFPPAPEVAPNSQGPWLVLRELHDFALGCFAFKRPRDSFGGRRRALAYDILSRVATSVDLPEVLQRARLALRKVNSVESREAASFLEGYFRAREVLPDDATIDALLSLVERTDSRSTAAQALNALVETNTISDLEALDHMDEWKSKHR